MSGLARRGGRGRGNAQSPLQNRVLIGAVTVLVLIVGVVIAFQTNNSLPFVQRYTLHLEVPNAEELVRGGDVNMGGSLIGFVTAIQAVHDRQGQPEAMITLGLDRDIQELPRDSRFTIRMAGAIGTKYVDVTRGHARAGWPNGATVPRRDTGASVDLDQVLDMFTPPTRVGVQASTEGLGDALAGRGADLNAAIGSFVPLTAALVPVMDNLASPQTNLTGFIDSLAALNAALVPVASAQAEAIRGLAGTFAALAGVARPYLQNTIADSPTAEASTAADEPAIDAATRTTAQLLARLAPGLATLPHATPILADAVTAANANLPGTAGVDRRLVSLSATLAAYSANPSVQSGLTRLTQTAQALGPPLAYLTPAQTGCDYLTTTAHNLASTLSNNVGNGTVLRFVLVAIDDVTGGEAVPSQSVYTSSSAAGGVNHGPLHSDAYPDTEAPGQPKLCSAGNEHYSPDHVQLGAS